MKKNCFKFVSEGGSFCLFGFHILLLGLLFVCLQTNGEKTNLKSEISKNEKNEILKKEVEIILNGKQTKISVEELLKKQKEWEMVTSKFFLIFFLEY